MLRAKYRKSGHCITMPEHFGRCKNDHFNSQIVYSLTGHRTRLPGRSVPCSDSRGQSGLNTAQDMIFGVFWELYFLVINLKIIK